MWCTDGLAGEELSWCTDELPFVLRLESTHTATGMASTMAGMVHTAAPSIHQDHILCRALVLPKQSPGLLGTILYRSPLQHRILKWLNHPCKLELIMLTSEG